jgi:drug/metabolite transporter (DMT)-like permease
MIQRVQSLWLLLAAACAFATFYFAFYSGLSNSNDPFLKAGANFLISAVTVAVGALALVTIFLFKKRTIQLRLCVLGIVLEALLIFLYYREVRTYAVGSYSLTAILHGVNVFAFFLAAKAINKDEKLIKDSDRLR